MQQQRMMANREIIRDTPIERLTRTSELDRIHRDADLTRSSRHPEPIEHRWIWL
jgi:hypothetical protein